MSGRQKLDLSIVFHCKRFWIKKSLHFNTSEGLVAWYGGQGFWNNWKLLFCSTSGHARWRRINRTPRSQRSCCMSLYTGIVIWAVGQEVVMLPDNCFDFQRKLQLSVLTMTPPPPLDLSFWSFLTFLHHGIEEVERHLLWKFYKKIRRKSWSNVPPKLVACIGFLYKVVHKIGRLRKFNRSRGI